MSAGGFLARAGHMGASRGSASMGFGQPASQVGAPLLLGLTAEGAVPAFSTLQQFGGEFSTAFSPEQSFGSGR